MVLAVIGDSLVGEAGDGRGGFALAVKRLVQAGQLRTSDGQAPQIVFYGVKGSSAKDWLSRGWLLPLLRERKPEQLVISLGTNDAAASVPWAVFRARLEELVELAHKEGVKDVTLIWPNEPKQEPLHEKILTYRASLLRQPVTGLRSFVGPEHVRRAYVADGGVHPSVEAHTPYALAVLNQVRGGWRWMRLAAALALSSAAIAAAAAIWRVW